jgi:tetratricopeptide (TPR) repeat protein
MNRGILKLGLALALSIAVCGAALANEWEGAYNSGRDHLQQGETDEAMADLEKALEIAPEGMDRANTLYMLAAADFQRQDIAAAARRLDEIIAYHDQGGFDDREFFKTVLNRAAIVAYQRKDREAMDAYTKRRMEVDATNPDIWDIDEAADTYRHRDTGIVYGPDVAGFKREAINVFKPNGTDVGGDYMLETEKGDITITVYATENIPLTAEQHLHSSIQSLRAEMHLPDMVREGEFAPWGDAGPKGKFQIYRATEAAKPVESGLWVVARGSTHFKMRVSYPASMSAEAGAAIERFIAGFGWPKQ